MRSAVRMLAWSWVALMLGGGCKRWRGGSDDAGVVDAGPQGPRSAELQTDDGWKIEGTLWPGAEGSTGAVLLLHQLGSNRGEWGPLVARLQLPPAVTVLAIDLRGHGESVQGPSSLHQTWEGFAEDPTRWGALPRDARAGAQYLFNAGASRSVVAVGSSIGATAAVAGLADEARVVGLAMVSPRLAYRGLDALGPLRAYAALGSPRNDAGPVVSRTAWMTAAAGDGDSAAGMATLATEAAGIAVEHPVVAGSEAHGVALLNAAPERWDALERYIRATLHAPRRAAAPAAVRTDAGARR